MFAPNVLIENFTLDCFNKVCQFFVLLLNFLFVEV